MPATGGQPRLRAVLVGVVLLLATGCQARLVLDLSLSADGGGRLAVTLGADRELQDRARAAGADPLADIVTIGAGLEQVGWELVDLEREDGWREVTLQVRFSTAEELNALAAELAGALAAEEAVLLDHLTVWLEGDRIRVEGVAALQPGDAVRDLGLQPEQAVDLLSDTEAFDYEIRVALPGEVLETSAADPEGPVLTWTVEPGQRVEILAVGDRPASLSWLPLLMAGVGALVVLVLLRRRACAR